MAKVKPTGERTMERRGKVVDGVKAVPTSRKSAHGPVISGVKEEAESAPHHDFYASVSAAELASLQGVQPIRRLGQIRTFSDPDPAQAEWLAREVRRWRCEGLPRAVSR